MADVSHGAPYGANYGATPPPWPPAGGGGGSASPPLASPGQRIVARALDYLIVGIVGAVFLFVMLVVVFGVTGSDDFGDGEDLVWSFFFFFAWGLWLCLYDWLCLMAWGATPGKAVVGIKVVSVDGQRLTQQQGLGRAAMFGLPQSITCLGHIFVLIESMVGFSDTYGQSIHDKAAKTYVVRSR
ncbi:RDD family protein [Spiractinospora alimapuensis]|uniref:RDD family protein n=1 Tax=Spiractinospora alimapuensis TaxID=2820884 RepID=UPI001F25045F|nr:RDD family protein [Spiractinospora alimapuensis]QVQ51436.1 RDD family protein [Spiractinospora alimapuensis]